MHLKSYAKVNFYLKIGEKQENSYHQLQSLMQTVDLYDSLFVEEITTSLQAKEKTKKEFNTIEIECSDPSISTEENLIYRAYQEIKENLPKRAFRIILKKTIPIQAGLGGGSSNGARFLCFLQEKYSLNSQKLQSLAQKLGSDVPFFLGGGGLAEVSGVGEKLKFYSKLSFPSSLSSSFSLFFPWSLCIVDSGVRVSTREAFRELDLYRSKTTQTFYRSKHFSRHNFSHRNSHASIQNLVQAIQEKNIDWFCENLYNDFEEVIFSNYEVLRLIQERLFLFGARGVLLSGSGGCLFGVFSSEKDAKTAQKRISEMSNSYRSFFCRAISRQSDAMK